MSGTVRTLTVAALTLAGLVAVPTAASAAVDTTCSYSKTKHLVTVRLPDADANESPVRVGRIPGAGRIGFDTDAIDWKVCGGATVKNTNTVKVLGTPQSEQVIITLEGGPLAPGFSRERTGVPDIEVVIDLGTGTDRLTLLGGVGADRLGFSSRASGTLNGDDDADLRVAGVDVWELDGGIGNDVLDGHGVPQLKAYGREGSDRITGGGGRDYLVGDAGTSPSADGDDVLQGGDGDDGLYGGGRNDRLVGGPGDDYLRPEGGRDVVLGGADNDYVAMEATPDGADTVSGGAGRDGVSYYQRNRPLTVSLDGRANDGVKGERDDIKADVENLDGGSKADVVTGSAGDNTLYGNAGDDTLRGGAGDDSLKPGDGDDVVSGGDGDDYLEPSSGNDRYAGDAGDDWMSGGSAADGRDVFGGGSGVDVLTYSGRTLGVVIDVSDNGGDGEPGENDAVRPDIERLYGGAGADTIKGGTLGEEIDGGAGNDSISGGRGPDYIRGGAGDDAISGGEGDDDLYGDDGDDTLSAIDGGHDYVDGGSHVGGDTAYVDASYDTVYACEFLIA